MVFIVGAGWVVGGMGMRSGMVVGVGSGWDSSLDGGARSGDVSRMGVGWVVEGWVVAEVGGAKGLTMGEGPWAPSAMTASVAILARVRLTRSRSVRGSAMKRR